MASKDKASNSKWLSTHSLLQVSLMTLLSRILGQGRITLWASLLATSPYADSFYIAIKLPSMLRAYFAEGAMNSALVPFYTRLLSKKNAEVRRAFVKKLVIFLASVFLVLYLSVLLFSSYLAKFYYILSAKADFYDLPSRLSYTADLIELAFPYLFFISFVSLIASILQSHGFVRPMAFNPIVFNIANLVLGLFILFQLSYDQGQIARWLTIVFVLAGVFQFLHIVWSLRILKKNDLEKSEDEKLADEKLADEKSDLEDLSNSALKAGKVEKAKNGEVSLKSFFKKFSPIVFSSMVHHINIFLIDPIALSLGGGSVALLFYSNRLLELPLGLLVFPLSMVALPHLAKLLRENKRKIFEQNISYAFSLLTLFLLPVMIISIYYRYEIISIVFQFGSFSESDVELTAQTFFFHALALPFLATYRLLATVFYSFQSVRYPVYAAFISLIFSLGLSYGLTIFFPSVTMIAFASTLATFFSASYLVFAAKKNLDIHLLKMLFKKVFFYIGIAVIPFVFTELMTRILRLGIAEIFLATDNFWLKKFILLAELGFFSVFFLLFYLIFLHTLKQPDFLTFLSSLRDRENRGVVDSNKR